MKKFFLIFAAVVLTAFSADVFAQSTGINPMIDSTHTYSVANHPGNSYSWSLQSTAIGGGAELFGSGVTDVASVVSGGSSYQLTVKWINPDIDVIYYLHVTETSSETSGSCTNKKVLAIQPKNNFQLFVYNVNSSGIKLPNNTSSDSLDYKTCAPAMKVEKWNGTDPVTTTNADDFTYQYDSLYFYYQVVATGINFETTDWTPYFTIEQSAGTGAVIQIDTIVAPTMTGTWKNSGWPTNAEQSKTIAASSAKHKVFWVRVKVANRTANENTTDNSYTYTLNIGSTGSSYSQVGTDPQKKTTNTQGTAPKQTQRARPDTGDITFD